MRLIPSTTLMAAICSYALVCGVESGNEHTYRNEPRREEPSALRQFAADQYLLVHPLKDSVQVSCHCSHRFVIRFHPQPLAGLASFNQSPAIEEGERLHHDLDLCMLSTRNDNRCVGSARPCGSH
jgi:hypothetical protein